MATMISMLLTIAFAFWFYRTAEKLHANPVQWAVAGALSYQLTAWAWMLVFTKPYLSGLQGVTAKTSASAGLIGHSWVLVGAVIAILVYRFALLKTNVRNS